MAKREAPEVNAGSMADIAFLLLIFFLVTTTIGVDQGINRLLPRFEDTPVVPIINERNIMRVLVNMDNQLLVNEEVMEIQDLRAYAVKFLDNNGLGNCNYCAGAKDPSLSDNPDEAVISLSNDGQTSYETYIAVQNELVAAYYELRDKQSMRRFSRTYRELEFVATDPASRAIKGLVEELEPKVKEIQEMYPMRLSEAEPKKNN